MGATRLCFLFCLFLASVSSQRKLYSIDDLRNSGYGNPPPRHELQLLFWFAQNVNVVNNNVGSNFYPSEDYGFRYFENRERIVPPLNYWESYNEVGNLNSPIANELPEYVQRYRNTWHQSARNIDRLIISVDQQRPYSISRVFITSHYHNSNDFNPDETYEIDPALILQIREIYCNDAISNSSSEDERCRQFLQQTRYNSNYCRRYGRRKKRSLYPQCNAYEGIKLQIKTSTQGYSKLIWENIPAEVMENYEHVYIDICQNRDSNKDHFMKEFKIQTSSGTLDTSVSLNAGLRPRLRLYTTRFIHNLINPYIWYGPEFDGANRVITFRIKRFDVGLQLYAKDGKACARLYIEKIFNWNDVLQNSWVGFYKSSHDKNDGYETYQYAVKFAMIDSTSIKNYDIYQYTLKTAGLNMDKTRDWVVFTQPFFSTNFGLIFLASNIVV
ncbi:hypothetical protein DPX16_9638 [Anabarilius grahami]|uniref:Uncharacterized protein n=1 Tax=Anabarilius grahami TaxID=495550 RepID=A0A3N0Y3F1_ANAGA|nr:hypothetical protein DPX16_9638 [Anabarilius grahami]